MKQKFNTIISQVHSNKNPMNSASRFSPTKPSPFLKQAFFPMKSENSLEEVENAIIQETISKKHREASSNNEFKEIDNIIAVDSTISKQFLAENCKNPKETAKTPASPRINNTQTLDFIVSPRILQISSEEIAKTTVFPENSDKNLKKSLGLSVKTKGNSRKSSRNYSPEGSISNNLMINSSLLERKPRNSFNLGNLFTAKTPSNKRRFSFGKTVESSLIFKRKSEFS